MEVKEIKYRVLGTIHEPYVLTISLDFLGFFALLLGLASGVVVERLH
jgi:hypothetical protein